MSNEHNMSSNTRNVGTQRKSNVDWIVTPGLKSTYEQFIDLYNRLYSGQKQNKIKRKPLMICGDTGVGKSLFSLIYKKLFSKDNPGVTIKELNCASFSSELILAELFGYEKGAFTGANRQKKGLLEDSSGGLIVLEEIGELRKEDQAKLLTFIENGGKYYKVGGTQELQSDVQIIATTNQPKDSFRDDFWSRFFQFYVPALYERKIDVLYYFYYLFPNIVQTFTQAEILTFLAYNWPGNVREIENIGFLIQWYDSFRYSGKKITKEHYKSSILRTENKYSPIKIMDSGDIFEFCWRLRFLNYQKFMNFLTRLGFSVSDYREAFPVELVELTMHEDEFDDIKHIDQIPSFFVYDFSLIDLYHMLCHPMDPFANKKAFDIQPGDLTDLFWIKAGFIDSWSAEEQVMRDTMQVYRTEKPEKRAEDIGQFNYKKQNDILRSIYRDRINIYCGNKKAAAKSLGVPYTTFLDRIKIILPELDNL